MKDNLIIATIITLGSVVPSIAGATDAVVRLPEPSILGLFAAAAIAIAVLGKLKK